MAETNAGNNDRPKLVLLIDADPATRQGVARLLAPSGLEVVQAREAVAGLEILQRLPDRFRLVIVSLEMPGIPGVALIATLKLFRPGLPVVCLTNAQPATAEAGGCLTKPVHPEALRDRVASALEGLPSAAIDLDRIRTDAVDRARAAFAVSRSIVDAARELVRGWPADATDV